MARNVALKVTLNDAQAKTLAKSLNRISMADFSQFAQGKGQERAGGGGHAGGFRCCPQGPD